MRTIIKLREVEKTLSGCKTLFFNPNLFDVECFDPSLIDNMPNMYLRRRYSYVLGKWFDR